MPFGFANAAKRHCSMGRGFASANLLVGSSFLMKVGTIALGVSITLALSAPALGAIIYVKPGGGGMFDGSTWGDAFANPQDAINASSGGDQIWVAAGVYKPTLEYVSGQAQSKSFRIGQGTKMYGGFAGTESSSQFALRNPAANQTILSGDIDNDDTLDADNAWHVVRIHWESGGPITAAFTQLDGFAITMGFADGSGLDDFGGGIFNYEASPIIQNCVIIKNYAVGGGAGMYIDGPTEWQEPPPQEAEQQLAEPQIRACRFLGNNTDNDGGGVYIVNGHGQFVCCELSGNSAEANGGGTYIATHNIAFQVPSEGVFINCTFANNEGTGRSVYNGDTFGALNTIMWDTGSAASHIATDASTVSTSKLTSNIEGDSSTLNLDPLYLSEKGGDTTAGTLDDDLRLNCSSPSINVGTSTIPPSIRTTLMMTPSQLVN